MSYIAGPHEPWATRDDLEEPTGCADCINEQSAGLVDALLVASSEVLSALTAGILVGRSSGTVRVHGPIGERIRLATPDPTVTAVLLDGEQMAGSFSVVDGEFLVPGDDVDWPLGQIANDTTRILEVTYSFGPQIPTYARQACVDLTCRVLKDLRAAGCSTLAPGLTSSNFQGTSIQIDPAAVTAAGIGSVKLLLDLVNPLKERVQSEVWSPELAEDLSIVTPVEIPD